MGAPDPCIQPVRGAGRPRLDGWKLLVLPHLLKHASALLKSHARETAELLALAALQLEKRLTKSRVGVDRQPYRALGVRCVDVESVLLRDVLALSPLLASLALLCVRIVDIEGM
ncbi:hypothetical protein POSPLADRAFT_1057429 [Postia placenta MAD-698-R-SB12]|uniref:Uncharacterized protein n=1 Tax=Postia placenta MAD-698-R-SB12 TaxID=670580 RepID=A0A1X6MZ66_9APHY|nr:hypothetical protein POSPLADRAFT_1057429 [Postia placenta MAD-698-R-SB12]OSX61658.1 hypothetical protein POSPLADRAFT_1057429 [Postia placenta MAD-698-R-SB12]